MVCNNCGRNIQNENANFCEYCGNSFRERGTFQTSAQNQVQNPIYGQMPGQVPNQMQNPMSMQMPDMMASQRTGEGQQTEKPITFLNWLGTYGILIGSLFIPFIGFLVPLVMLFIWAFNNRTPVSKKNWARVNLIVVAFLIIFYVLIFITFMRTPMFQQMLNGTFDMNSYLNSLSGAVK